MTAEIHKNNNIIYYKELLVYSILLKNVKILVNEIMI